MTKRPSPFEPHISRQSKIHLNNYENDSNALRDLKERTLKKLLEGPKRLHSIVLNEEGNLFPVENDLNLKNNNFMQKLVTNYFTVNGRIVNETGKVFISPIESFSNCFFCNSKTDSTFQCIHCLEFFCSACSFVNYESFEDKRICLSCS